MTTGNDHNDDDDFDDGKKYKFLKFLSTWSLQDFQIRIIREIFQTLMEQRDAVIKSEFDKKINSMDAMSASSRADFKTKLLETSHLIDTEFKDKIRSTEIKLMKRIDEEFGKLHKMLMWAIGVAVPVALCIVTILLTGPKK